MENNVIQQHKALSWDWKALLWSIAYFWYFSAITQGLVFFSGTVGFEGLRNSFYLSLLWLIPILLFPKYTRSVAGIIGLVLWGASIGSLGYYVIYGQEFSQSVIFVMFESNSAEAGEYLSQYFSWSLVLALAAYSVGGYLLWRKVRPVYIANGWAARIVSAMIFILVMGYPYVDRMMGEQESFSVASEKVFNRMEPAAPWQMVVGYYQYKKQLSDMESLLKENRELPPLANFKDSSGDKPRTLVLVIGESTSRAHMGLYGYGRDTNPLLTKLKQTDSGLTVFNDVVAARPYTIEMLQQALTFADQKHPDDYLTTPSIINVMKQAGYKTFWITNQQTMTKRNTMLTTFSQMADEQHYLNNNRSQNAEQHDEVVFEPFKAALKDAAPKKFIVIHLLGTHMNYKYRYPDAFDVFKTQDKTVPAGLGDRELTFYNTYDNAIRYNDFVVSSVVNDFKAQDPNGFLVYLSDHGEEIYGDAEHEVLGRNEAAPTKGMYTIPFMVWRSESWRKDHPQDLSAYVNRPYSSSHLIHTLSDLAGLSFDKFIPADSLVNAKFVPQTRWIGDPHGKLKSYDTFFGTPAIFNKPVVNVTEPQQGREKVMID